MTALANQYISHTNSNDNRCPGKVNSVKRPWGERGFNMFGELEEDKCVHSIKSEVKGWAGDRTCRTLWNKSALPMTPFLHSNTTEFKSLSAPLS